MTKPVLLAGLLGGVAGALLAFGLARTFPATPKPPPAPPPSEAKPLADELIAKLKAGQNEEFLSGVRQAFSGATDEQLNQARQSLFGTRDVHTKEYGRPSEFEFLREMSLGPNLVRFAYLEKFPRGCVVWTITYYYTPEGWQVLNYFQPPVDAAFGMLR